MPPVLALNVEAEIVTGPPVDANPPPTPPNPPAPPTPAGLPIPFAPGPPSPAWLSATVLLSMVTCESNAANTPPPLPPDPPSPPTAVIELDVELPPAPPAPARFPLITQPVMVRLAPPAT